MSYDFSRLPVKMQDINAWLLWHKYPKQGGGFKKVPDEFSRNGATWDSIKLLPFVEAKTRLYSPSSLSDGIGIAFTKTNQIAGIDIDNAILPGVTIPKKDSDFNLPVMKEVLPILQQAQKDGCYIEISVSGTGYHIYGYCTVKERLLSLFGTGKIVSENVEIYYADSYFTVSGKMHSGNWGCIDNAIRLAYKTINGKHVQKPTETPEITPTTAVKNEVRETVPQTETTVKKQAETVLDGEFSDDDVLHLPGISVATALNFMSKDTRKYGAETFDALQNGYPDENINKSDFDEKIIGTLCYWLYRFGESEIVRVFEQSALYRSPETTDKAKGYVAHSVHRAYQNAEKFFPAADYKALTTDEKNKLKKWVKRKERET